MTETEKTLAAMLAETKPTLVEFYRPDCPKKEEAEGVMNELKARMGNRANVLRIDGTAEPGLMKEYKIGAYPTVLLFKDGQVAWRDTGHKPLSELEHMVREFI